MQVRILGAHQAETRDTRFMSILVDGRLAIDAGGLTSTLTLEEQLQIDALLITHRHLDHMKDLPGLVHNLWGTKGLDIYGLEATCEAIKAHIFNDVVWPDVTKHAAGRHTVSINTVQPNQPFEVLDYRVLALEVSHTVPAVGYLVEQDGKSFFYTADTRGEGHPSWATIRPDLLLTETTMASHYEQEAAHFGHMTPLSLERELRAFHAQQGYYPRTLCVHINPNHEPQIRQEIAALANKLNADITLAHEGLVVEV